MKKIGIVADNYKVTRFEQELDKQGFTDRLVFPGPVRQTKLIQVLTTEEKFPEDQKRVKKLCLQLENEL